MANSVIGSLIVNLRASTASFATDLSKAKDLAFSNSKEIERSFKIMGTAVTAAIVSVGTSAYALAQSSINLADKMGKMAKSTGLTVEEFSDLSYAAKLSGSSTEALSTSLVILSKNLEKSNQQTLEGKAAHSALATLFHGNIPIFHSTNEAFIAISEQLSRLPEGFQRTALQAQILGKGSASLATLVGEGAAGISILVDQAKKLGIEISGTTAKAAADFNDDLSRLHTAVEGLGLRLAQELLPYLQSLSKSLVEITKNAASSATLVTTLKTSVQVFATAIVAVAGALYVAGNALATFLVGMKILLKTIPGVSLLTGDLTDDINQFKASLDITKGSISSVGGVFSKIWTPGTEAGFDAVQMMRNMWQQTKPLSDGINDNSNKVAEFISNIKDEIATLGMSKTQIDLYKAAQMGATAADLEAIKVLDGKLDRIKKILNLPQPKPIVPNPGELGPLLLGTPDIPQPKIPDIPLPALNVDFTSISDDVRTLNQSLQEQANILNNQDRPAAERYRNAMDILNLLKANGLSAAAYKIEVDKLNESFSKSKNVVLQVRQATSEMFTQAIFRAGSFKEAMGNILERLAEVIFQVKVLDPLLDNLFRSRATGGASGGGILGSIIGAIGSVLGGIFGGGAGSVLGDTGGSVGGSIFDIGSTPTFAAAGATAFAGSPFIVGEKGPELFFPSQSGTIMPNGKGFGASVVYNIDARGAQRGVSQEVLQALKASEDRAVLRTRVQIKEDQARKA